MPDCPQPFLSHWYICGVCLSFMIFSQIKEVIALFFNLKIVLTSFEHDLNSITMYNAFDWMVGVNS